MINLSCQVLKFRLSFFVLGVNNSDPQTIWPLMGLKPPSHIAGSDAEVSRSKISFTPEWSGNKELKMSTKNNCLAMCTRWQYGVNKEQHEVNTTVP